MKRITRKYLINWINNKFKELEIFEYEVYDVEPTRFSGHLLEGGAACLFIRFKRKGDGSFMAKGTFYSFYRIYDIQKHIENGWELWLNPNMGRYGTPSPLNNWELDLRKQSTIPTGGKGFKTCT